MRGLSGIRAITVVTITLALAIAGVGTHVDPASAATPPVGSFPVWTQASPTSFTGQLASAAGGGVISVATDANGARVAETGQQAFIGAQTGFGMRFGTSRYQSYLTFGSVGGAVSTTTVTLPSLPVGWGFAVGDIDADLVTISATGPGGTLTPAELGAQDTTGTPYLNYCRGASPKPSGCGAGTTFDDFPWWCPDAGAGATCAGLPAYPTVLGQGADTAGAYDWFVPTVAVDELVLEFRVQTGIPVFQLWIVVPATAATVSGQVLLPSAPAPAGTSLALTSSGAAVPGLTDEPVVIPVAADGSYSFVTEYGSYALDLTVPEGYAAADPSSDPLVFTASADTLDLGTLALREVLPATGRDLAPLLLGALALLLVGTALVARPGLRR